MSSRRRCTPLAVLGAVFVTALTADARAGAILTAPIEVFPAGTFPEALAVGDVDSDGVLDIVVNNQDWPASRVTVLLGQGDARFSEPVFYANPGSPAGLVLADLDADGDLDVVVANGDWDGTPTNNVSVLHGRGDGRFDDSIEYMARIAPFDVAVVDINADGYKDILTANRGSHDVTVLLGRSDGGYEGAVHYPVGASAYSIAVGDVNRDGRLDVMTANGGIESVSLLLGNGDGSSQPSLDCWLAGRGRSMVLEDLDADGNLDVAASVLDEQISVLFGNGDGTFQADRGEPRRTCMCGEALHRNRSKSRTARSRCSHRLPTHGVPVGRGVSASVVSADPELGSADTCV